MAITKDEIIERAKRLAGAGVSPDIWARAELDLAACLNIAVHELSEDVMRDDYRRAYLQQDYSVAVNSAGVGSILAATGTVTGAADILLDSIQYGRVKDADGNVLVWYPHKDSFYNPLPTVFGYYCLSGRSILTRAIAAQCTSEADVQPAATPLTITASYAPSDLAYMPDQLGDDLAKQLVTVVTRKVKEMDG